MTPALLTELCAHLVDATTWTTRHPSCRTLLRWLTEAGFRSATPTHAGGRLACGVFDRLDESERPRDMAEVDALLRLPVEVATSMEAPVETPAGRRDPPITAEK